MSNPLISVLIVCRNPGARLRVALAGVWAQRHADAELVVVDGGSTDGSAEWLATERGRLGALHIGRDQGVYDGMNKALGLARGEWVLFLGADDYFASDDVLTRAAVSLAMATQDVAVVAGEARYDDGRCYSFAGVRGAIRRNFVHHQAAFYRCAAVRAAGGFDRSLHVMADYDLNLRLMHEGRGFNSLPLRISQCGVGGISDAGRWLGYREEIVVRHRYFSAVRCLPWDVLSVVRFLRKKMLRSMARPRPDQRPSPQRRL